MPPHSSHLIQPLDVGCVSPLKTAYGLQVEKLMRCQVSYITKTELLSCFTQVYFYCFT
jgi:hypothetical protein